MTASVRRTLEFAGATVERLKAMLGAYNSHLKLIEQRLEVHQVMDDMRCAGIDFLTMGQYLQPTPKHAKVTEFVTPQAFDAYGAIARAKGFLQVASSPLTRSSYHAGDDFREMRATREAQLAKARG